MSIFELAELQLIREGKSQENTAELAKRVIVIAEWLKKHGRHTRAIMQGGKVYTYGNIVKTYARAI